MGLENAICVLSVSEGSSVLKLYELFIVWERVESVHWLFWHLPTVGSVGTLPSLELATRFESTPSSYICGTN